MNKAIKYLNSKGIEFQTCGYGKNKGNVSILKIPFTSDEIVDVLDKEGESLQVCCSAVSEIRDIMFSVVREGRWIETRQLKKVHDLALQHAHFEKTNSEEEDWKSPILRLVYIWENIETGVKVESTFLDKFYKLEQEDPKEALGIISRYSTYIGFQAIVSNPVTKEDFRHVPLMIDFIKLSNAMKCYLDHCHKISTRLGFEPTNVFALTDKDGNILSGHIGACVFGDRPTAVKVRDGDKDIFIRPGTISLEKGLILEASAESC